MNRSCAFETVFADGPPVAKRPVCADVRQALETIVLINQMGISQETGHPCRARAIANCLDLWSRASIASAQVTSLFPVQDVVIARRECHILPDALPRPAIGPTER